MAILSLVPTPSVAETRIGSINPAFFRSKTPPKLPTFPATPGMFVVLTFGLIKETNLFPSSMFTHGIYTKKSLEMVGGVVAGPPPPGEISSYLV